jgi:hypothetical protein
MRLLRRSRGVCSEGYGHGHGEVIGRPVKEPEQARWPELSATGEIEARDAS